MQLTVGGFLSLDNDSFTALATNSAKVQHNHQKKSLLCITCIVMLLSCAVMGGILLKSLDNSNVITLYLVNGLRIVNKSATFYPHKEA